MFLYDDDDDDECMGYMKTESYTRASSLITSIQSIGLQSVVNLKPNVIHQQANRANQCIVGSFRRTKIEIMIDFR
jgi:hypothetical protein